MNLTKLINKIESYSNWIVFGSFGVVATVMYNQGSTFIGNDILFSGALFVIFIKIEKIDRQIKQQIIDATEIRLGDEIGKVSEL